MNNIMKTITAALFTVCLFFVVSCGEAGKKGKETIVLIKTGKGDMKVKLYNETPKHRDNFIKLAKAGFYDGLIFHRVIENFMIQGGDPESRNAKPGQRLGNGGPGYQIDAEFNPKFIHKKGALSAARLGDNVNPEKRSSGSQFYIVQGEKFTESSLETLKKNKLSREAVAIFRKLYKQKADELRKLKESENYIEFANIYEQLQKEADAEAEKAIADYTPGQKEIYSTLGGTPHLDAGYTVFGEVIDGTDVIDSIAAVETGAGDRPVEDIKMYIKVVKKWPFW